MNMVHYLTPFTFLWVFSFLTWVLHFLNTLYMWNVFSYSCMWGSFIKHRSTSHHISNLMNTLLAALGLTGLVLLCDPPCVASLWEPGTTPRVSRPVAQEDSPNLGLLWSAWGPKMSSNFMGHLEGGSGEDPVLISEIQEGFLVHMCSVCLSLSGYTPKPSHTLSMF